MSEECFVLLDTKAFEEALGKKDKLISAYTALNNDYDACIERLLKNWKGRGADAFEKDANIVRQNIAGTFDIIKTMCDTLEDCRAIFAECDRSLGAYNRDPDSAT